MLELDIDFGFDKDVEPFFTDEEFEHIEMLMSNQEMEIEECH